MGLTLESLISTERVEQSSTDLKKVVQEKLQSNKQSASKLSYTQQQESKSMDLENGELDVPLFQRGNST